MIEQVRSDVDTPGSPLSGEVVYRSREPRAPAFLLISGMWALVLLLVVVVAVIVGGGEGLRSPLNLGLFVLFGLVVPAWILTLQVSVRVAQDELRAGVWPLPATRIPGGSVHHITTDIGDPFRYHGGFVPAAGPRHDRGLGYCPDAGVRIVYAADEGAESQLTILTPRSEELATLLGTWAGPDHENANGSGADP